SLVRPLSLTSSALLHSTTPLFLFQYSPAHQALHSFPTRRSSDLDAGIEPDAIEPLRGRGEGAATLRPRLCAGGVVELCVAAAVRSEEHTSELQSLAYLVCRLLLEKKKKLDTG